MLFTMLILRSIPCLLAPHLSNILSNCIFSINAYIWRPRIVCIYTVSTVYHSLQLIHGTIEEILYYSPFVKSPTNIKTRCISQSIQSSTYVNGAQARNNLL
ncbi:MAG: hypothetical protein J3Q66DRAFT_28825 [Benniella sp.]|nr:MAG: hypothetical protein J3Q66DRAFT_28825 [Benniella sp.]